MRVGYRRVDDVLANVVAQARPAGRGDEHGMVGAGPRARYLVLGQDLAQQREHVDSRMPASVLSRPTSNRPLARSTSRQSIAPVADARPPPSSSIASAARRPV